MSTPAAIIGQVVNLVHLYNTMSDMKTFRNIREDGPRIYQLRSRSALEYWVVSTTVKRGGFHPPWFLSLTLLLVCWK